MNFLLLLSRLLVVNCWLYDISLTAGISWRHKFFGRPQKEQVSRKNTGISQDEFLYTFCGCAFTSALEVNSLWWLKDQRRRLELESSLKLHCNLRFHQIEKNRVNCWFIGVLPLFYRYLWVLTHFLIVGNKLKRFR